MEADITYAEQQVNFYYCESYNRKYRMHFVQQSCDYLGFEEPDSRVKSLSLEHTYSKCQNIVRLKNINDTYKHSQYIRKASSINSNSFAINRIYSFIHNGKITITLETGVGGNKSQSFTYDYRGFLTNETGGSLNMIYAYDNNGNMTYKQNMSGGTPITLTYDNSTSGLWADRLLSYDGKQIKYDPKFLGNPKYYGTFNGQGELISGITYGWEGKNLTYYHNSETQKEITYVYNDANLRISKTVNSVLTSYTYEGDRLVMEQSGTKTKRFIYDEVGLLIGFSYQNGSSINRYFYIRDQLGHILGIVDTLGTVVVRYTYDAWGNILSVTGILASTIGQMNPFRYKGYYYDSETGYYYCQTRYYVPMWCRWLSSDKVSYLYPENINGINLYMYCGNNPVMFVDPSGCFVISAALLIFGFLLGSTIGAATSIISQGILNGWDNINCWQVLLDAAIGGISGLMGFSGINAIGSAIISGTLGFMGSVGGDLIESNGDWSKVNWKKAAIMTVVNFGLGLGPGAQNSKAIGKNLGRSLSSNKSINIIGNAMAKQSVGQMSKRGFQGVINLYGKQLINAISKEMTSVMIGRTGIALGGILINSMVEVGLELLLN